MSTLVTVITDYVWIGCTIEVVSWWSIITILPLVVVVGSIPIWSIAVESWTIVVDFQSIQLLLNTFQSFR